MNEEADDMEKEEKGEGDTFEGRGGGEYEGVVRGGREQGGSEITHWRARRVW